MKDSGVKWIGQIPINTKIVKLKSISNIINGYAFKSEMFTDDENELNVITISSFDNQKILPEKLSYSIEKKDFSKYLLQENDILIAMSGGTVGKNVLVKNIRKNMYINQRVCILRSQYYKYISYWINSDSFKEYTLLNSIGSAQPNISSTQLNEFDIPWSNEVEKVVDILDEKISIIEDIIVKTKNSIEELKKYKQSLITEVVTKGLDKNVEMKDSGIEWIGEIPKEWETIKGKYLFKKMQREIEVNEIVTAFRDGQVVQRKKRRTDGFTNSLQEHGYQGIRKGDLVIHSMDAFAGAIGVSEDDGKSTPVYIVLDSVKPNLNHEYFSYLMRTYSILGYIESMAKGIRVRSTDFKYDTFANTLLINPPIAEQNKIVEYINRKQKNIDELIDKKIELINEYESYKKSLIYEYVTGKKEVGEEVE